MKRQTRSIFSLEPTKSSHLLAEWHLLREKGLLRTSWSCLPQLFSSFFADLHRPEIQTEVFLILSKILRHFLFEGTSSLHGDILFFVAVNRQTMSYVSPG